MISSSTIRSLIRTGIDRALRSKSAWAMIGNFSQQGLSFIIFAILARYLDPNEVGLLAICYLFTQGARAIVLDPISVPYMRQANATDDDASWSFTILTAVGASVTALLLIIAPLMARAFHTPDLTSVLRAMAFVIGIHGMTRIYETRLIRVGDYRLLALRSILAVICGGLTAGFLATIHAGVWILVGQQLVSELIMLIVVVMKERKTWIPKLIWDRSRFKATTENAIQIFPGVTAWFAAANADNVMISFYYGPTALGYYSFAKRILSAIYLIGGSSITSVGLTSFIQQQGNPTRIGQTLLNNSRLSLSILSTAYLTLTLVQNDLISFLFGDKWSSAVVLFAPLMLAGLCQLLWLQFSNIGTATGLFSLVSRTSIFQLTMFLIGSFILIKGVGMGPASIAYSLLLSTLFSAIGIAYFVGKRTKINIQAYWLAPVPCILTSIIALFIVRPLSDSINTTNYFVLISAGALFLLLLGTTLIIDRLIFKNWVVALEA